MCPLLSPYAALSFFTALHSLTCYVLICLLSICLFWNVCSIRAGTLCCSWFHLHCLMHPGESVTVEMDWSVHLSVCVDEQGLACSRCLLSAWWNKLVSEWLYVSLATPQHLGAQQVSVEKTSGLESLPVSLWVWPSVGLAPMTVFEKSPGISSWVHVVAVVLCIWYFSQCLSLSQYVCHQPGAAINLLWFSIEMNFSF